MEGNRFCVPIPKGIRKSALSASIFVADHVRKAALAVDPGRCTDPITFAISLPNWMVNKGKVAPKTVQSILRNSRIQTPLELCIQQEADKTCAAAGAFLRALRTPKPIIH